MGYTGWRLRDQDRERLVAVYPFRFADEIAHHCTAEFGVGEDHPLPEDSGMLVVGEVFDDLKGVQALICEVAGTTTRPDGRTYHVTWSLDRRRGASARMSKDVIDEKGIERARVLYYIVPEPAYFEV